MTESTSPILLWFRRDLRLSDHPALNAAVATGRPVIPIFLHDEGIETLGAAARLRIGFAVGELARALEALGSRLILRRGPALQSLTALVSETQAGTVWWSRLHDPMSQRRDEAVSHGLRAAGIETRAWPGHLLFEPEKVATGTGGSFKVYGAFFKSIVNRDPGLPLPAPDRLMAPASWPRSDRLEDWRLSAALRGGAPIVAAWQRPGERRAHERLECFLAEKIGSYPESREYPSLDGTSGLSENLTYGEISVRTCWRAGLAALERGEAGADRFLRELAWREFSHHLLFHAPGLAMDPWRPEWRSFPWTDDAEAPLVQAWKKGRTGVRLVDAAMREMYVTGRMHNRARMIVASFLTKHMMVHWRVGLTWFEECLTDWDPASNAVNWQWVAGSGPDAAPFFRIFNPVAQAKTYDAEGRYAQRWIAEGQSDAPATALSFFEAVPRSWGLSSRDPYPAPVLDLALARERALEAFRARSRRVEAVGGDA
ncbi:cryptochrome/photolyase family protein [Rubellimicrobium arenae]|uniref:cryptochrome/photolyase family protein n=1 Tax=Rubellimicrobium arenae TaxID=2817372 RepID=UPI001B316C10|nr:deoxyribodipyrimidine photo-lyase [Rubellimicrobium arenae]